MTSFQEGTGIAAPSSETENSLPKASGEIVADIDAGLLAQVVERFLGGCGHAIVLQAYQAIDDGGRDSSPRRR